MEKLTKIVKYICIYLYYFPPYLSVNMTDSSTEFPELLEVPNADELFDFPEVPNADELFDFPEFPEPSALPADFNMFCNVVSELMQETDLDLFPDFTTPEVLNAINPSIARLNEKGWRRLGHELTFWDIILRMSDIFSAYSTRTLSNEQGCQFISVTDDGVNIDVRLSSDGTGIMVSICQIFNGLICNATFIVEPMKEITVCNVNETHLHERIVVASVVDDDVLFSDIIHPDVNAIYIANRDALETLLNQHA